MSRVGNNPISIPDGVSVTLGDEVTVKGPKGQLSAKLVAMVTVEQTDGTLVFSRSNNSKQAKSNHGLMRSLVNNMVVGVTAGFTKNLEVHGVGYRADVRGKNLVLNLGYSHPIEHAIPDGVTVVADKGGKITVSGSDKQLVGQVAAEIRSYRRPDAYKGKGIRYSDEYIRLKAGKSA